MLETRLQRALRSATDEPVAAAPSAEEMLLFVFRLGSLLVGVDSALVREVVRASRLTPLPRVPSFLLGVMSHRGEVLPVVDLLRILGKGEGRLTPSSRLFVGLTKAYVAAVLVEEVQGLVTVSADRCSPPPLGSTGDDEYVRAVIANWRQGETLTVLALDRLLASARARAVAR